MIGLLVQESNSKSCGDYVYTRGGGGFVSRGDKFVSVTGPQFEFQCVCKACYEGSNKSCGGNAYMRGGGGFVSRGGEKAQKVVLLVSLVPQLEFQCICYEGNGKSCGE